MLSASASGIFGRGLTWDCGVLGVVDGFPEERKNSSIYSHVVSICCKLTPYTITLNKCESPQKVTGTMNQIPSILTKSYYTAYSSNRTLGSLRFHHVKNKKVSVRFMAQRSREPHIFLAEPPRREKLSHRSSHMIVHALSKFELH